MDEVELQEFLRERYPRLVGAVALVTGDAASAEDAVQEAIVRAWERTERGEQIVALDRWVAAVAMNREAFAGFANAQTAPTDWSSSVPPIRAMLPSAESASLAPNAPAPISPLPVSFDPCWIDQRRRLACRHQGGDKAMTMSVRVSRCRLPCRSSN